jgi:F420H(2)-dependent quinone reductase
MWRAMTSVWAAYDDYQRRTDREIPLVVFERQTEGIGR